jgi:hypothetical protein
LTDAQRDQLRFCADWLARHQSSLSTLFVMDAESGEGAADLAQAEDEQMTIEEEIGPHESRYAPLAAWLQNRPPNKDVVYVKFEQIEELIDGPLPASAYKHRAWWANDSTSHTQSQQWLDVGWRVGEVAMSSQRVRFVRIKGLEGKYIDFFSALLNDLREKTQMPLKKASPHGSSYHHLTWLRFEDGPRALIFAFAFARGKRCRIELYIETRDKSRNKAIFDQLYAEKADFESALGASLTWERLNENRASRIAWYRPGSIQSSEEEREALRAWLVEAIPAFYEVFIEPAKAALATVTAEE